MRSTALLALFALLACDPSTESKTDAALGAARPDDADSDAQSSDAAEATDGGADASEPLEAAAPPPEVRWFGNLKSVFDGNWSTATTLNDALSGSSSYGLGALSELRGEFLVIGGNAMLVYPTETALPRVVASHHGHGTNETATLLVAADVPAWREFPITKDVPSAELEGWIRSSAEAAGVDVSRPFPFLLRGVFRNVGWHVADGTRVEPGMRPDTNAQHGTIVEGEGTVVGFYSTQHQGVFTMMGENTHMHMVLSDHTVLGHVRALDVASGGVLSLP